MKAEGIVGPQVLADGASNEVRMGRLGELVVTELHGKYYEGAFRGNVFANTAASATFLAATGTAITPISLFNPVGSGKNLVLLRTVLSITTLSGTQVAGAFAYYAAVNTVVSSVTANAVAPVSSFLGSGSQPVAKVYTTVTSSITPTLVLPIMSKTGAANSVAGLYRVVDDLDGMIILAPGTLLSIFETAADTTSNYFGIVGFVWEEVAV